MSAPKMDKETATLIAYAQGFLHDCEDCGARVVSTANRVYLDSEPNVDGDWMLMPVGDKLLAAAGAPRGQESRFDLHAHQPPEAA